MWKLRADPSQSSFLNVWFWIHKWELNSNLHKDHSHTHKKKENAGSIEHFCSILLWRESLLCYSFSILCACRCCTETRSANVSSMCDAQSFCLLLTLRHSVSPAPPLGLQFEKVYTHSSSIKHIEYKKLHIIWNGLRGGWWGGRANKTERRQRERNSGR